MSSSKPNPLVQLAILVGIAVMTLNAGFFFLSDAYFTSRARQFGAEELARLSGARQDFVIFTLVVGGAVILAARYPRGMAHGIPLVVGALSLIAGLFAFEIGFVLPATLLIVASALVLLVFHSLQKSRAAWALLSGLCSVYGVVLFFGAPKIRGLVGVGMWIALIVPGLLGVATTALRQIRSDYREP